MFHLSGSLLQGRHSTKDEYFTGLQTDRSDGTTFQLSESSKDVLEVLSNLSSTRFVRSVSIEDSDRELVLGPHSGV